MKVSKTAASAARRIFRLCQENGELDEARLKMAIKKIATDKPRDYRAILQTLKRLVTAHIAARTVKVESAVELSPAEKGNITKTLRAKHGEKVDVSYGVDAELLGGLRIQVGDTVYDSSVKARLERLANSF